MTLHFNVNCPHCGHENRISLDKPNNTQMVLCDLDNGGCDKHFAVDCKARVDTEVLTLQPSQNIEQDATIPLQLNSNPVIHKASLKSSRKWSVDDTALLNMADEHYGITKEQNQLIYTVVAEKDSLQQRCKDLRDEIFKQKHHHTTWMVLSVSFNVLLTLYLISLLVSYSDCIFK